MVLHRLRGGKGGDYHLQYLLKVMIQCKQYL